MERTNRKIILSGIKLDAKQFTLDGVNGFNNDYLFFDPIDLFHTVDWTSYKSNSVVFNQIYQRLFKAFVMEKKTLICYWPSTDFPDSYWFEFMNYSKKAGITMEATYFKKVENDTDELPSELQLIWKELVLELVESISDDIVLNEGLEEIAQLKSVNSSITIFSQRKENKLGFFYMSSLHEVFEFEPQYEFERGTKHSDIIVFENFESLISALDFQLDLTSFNVEFLNNTLEKVYFKSLLRNNLTINLIQDWVETYSLN